MNPYNLTGKTSSQTSTVSLSAPYMGVDFEGNGFDEQENLAIEEEQPRVGSEPVLSSQAGVNFVGEEESNGNGNGSATFRGSPRRQVVVEEPREMTALEVLLIFAVLTLMIIIFVQCTLPGVLFLLGRRPPPSAICIILGSLWLVNVTLVALSLLI